MSPDANASQADFFGHDPAAGVRELARALRLSLEPQAEKLLAQQLGAILRDFQASASSLESPAAAPVVWAAPAALRADLVRPSNLARSILAGAHRRESEYFVAAEPIPASPAAGEQER